MNERITGSVMRLAQIQPTEVIRFMQSRKARRLIMFVNVCLVIWIAALLASLTWDLLPMAEDEATDQIQPVQVSQSRPDPGQQLITQMPGWHLLGVPGAENTPRVSEIPKDAPDTRLRLTLRGALASDQKENARAIIADQAGKEDQYAIGDTLPGNAELSEIYADRVILKRNGSYETLRLPDDSGKSGPGSIISGRSSPIAPSVARVTPAARLRDVRNRLQRKPSTIGRMIQVQSKQDESGNMVGYSVRPGADPELFDQMGLQEDDLVTQVNEFELSDPANGGKALTALQSGEPVTVKLLRQGQEMTLSLDGTSLE